MRKIALIGLAASAAMIATAGSAQSSASGSASHGASSSSSSSFSSSQSRSNVMVRHQGGHFFRPGFHPGPNFRHHRLQRGFFVHPFWFGPQFHVRNWQLYGFAQPPRDHRWVRFYDDAYLIDRNGRVADHRYDLDWDEYGEPWALEDGIPAYHGSNDWRPGEDDHAWVEEQRERHAGGGHDDEDYDDEDYADEGYRHGPPPGCHSDPRPCGGYLYPYPGYGYGVMYPAIIIETTVTTGGCCEEVVEEVVEVRRRPARRHRRVVRPRPPAGERG